MTFKEIMQTIGIWTLIVLFALFIFMPVVLVGLTLHRIGKTGDWILDKIGIRLH